MPRQSTHHSDQLHKWNVPKSMFQISQIPLLYTPSNNESNCTYFMELFTNTCL